MHALAEYTIATACISLGISLCVVSRDTVVVAVGAILASVVILTRLKWMIEYLLVLVNMNLRLCIVWAVILTVMLPLVFEGVRPRQQNVSQVRKFFHLVAVILFLPPLRQDNKHITEFVAAAGISMIGLFVLLESLRITKRPFAHRAKHILFRMISPFLDHKDKRATFVSSHIQLIAACILPPAVLVITNRFPNELIALSGILTVGIGDAAAALGGILCGGIYPLPWNKSKSLPGLVAFVVSVLAALQALGLLSVKALSAGVIAGLAETILTTYDNIVLPVIFSIVVLVFNIVL